MLLFGPMFRKDIRSCGSTKSFEISKISHNLYEAKASDQVALLWKEGDSWKSSSNFICEETAEIIGTEIELFLSAQPPDDAKTES